MIWNDYKAQIQNIDIKHLTSQNIQLSILREDLIHPEISGNKYRKLKYNFIEAEKLYKKSEAVKTRKSDTAKETK